MSAFSKEKGTELGVRPRRGWYRKILAMGGLAFLVHSTAHALTELRVHLEGESEIPAEVTVVDPNGQSTTLVDDDGDGWILPQLEGPTGNYVVTIKAGEHSATRTIALLETGGVVLTYTPAQDPSEIVFEYRGDLRSDDEIVVTARRREEGLQSIPVSVAAFTAESLESRSIVSLRDVGEITPNVDFSVSNGLGGASSEATVYIRGIGQIDTALFADPGVGIYVDGVYLARAGGSVLDILDLERVEVLRGPQGTLFGKNTTGGAISLITRKPGNQRLLDVGITIGNLDRIDARATADFQLSEDLFATVAAASTHRDGIIRAREVNRFLADDNRDVFRGALRWLAADNLVLDFSTEFMSEREFAADPALLAVVSADLIDFYNAAISGAGGTPLDERFVAGSVRDTFATAESRNRGDVAGSTLTLSWTTGDLDITSISAYREVEFDVASDGDGSPVTLAERSFVQEQSQISQELHVGGSAFEDRLQWLAGGLYFSESSEEDSQTLVLGGLFEALEAAPGPIFAPPGVPDFLCFPGPPPPGLPCFGGAGNPLNFAFFTGPGDFERIELDTDSWALFGEGTYALSDKLSATLGLRYTVEEKDFDFFRRPGNGGPNVDLSNSDDWDAVSPRFSLSYQASEETLIYASAARGFKSGGFNGRPQERLALDPFDPERLWAYELGWKTDLFDDHLRLNGAAFFSDYSDIQFTASLNIDGDPVFVIQNAGQAEVKGFELELDATSKNGFDVSAGVGYIETEYTDLEGVAPNSVTLSGVFPKTPEWTASLSPQYVFSLAEGGRLTLRADYSYRGKVFNDISNTPQIAQDAYSLLSARLVWSNRDEDWQVAFFGTNLGDEEYLEHGFFAAAFGAAIGVPGRPREWGLSFRYSFF